MLKKLLYYHLLPLCIALVLVSITVYTVSQLSVKGKAKTITISGKQEKIRGFYGNLLTGDQAELDFIASIKNKDQLTIFGSSEFSDSPYASFNFLPDSLGIKAMGVGHAFHQEFSILCELLAADEYMNGSEICIILSPGWFETTGTNVEAFLEFVRPNFLNRIANNPTIGQDYRSAVGEFIDRNYENIAGVSHSMNTLRDSYLETSGGFISRQQTKMRNILMGGKKIDQPSYQVELNSEDLQTSWSGDYNGLMKTLQDNFVSSIKSNKIYVYDDYYTQYVLDEKGKAKRGTVSDINIEESQEMKDFLLLVQYLKEKNTKCSFIIQPLNAYHYDGLAQNNDLIRTITKVLDKNKIPYYNMYVSNKKHYEPGTLKDIMHLGDYGWMRINRFLDKVYNEQ